MNKPENEAMYLKYRVLAPLSLLLLLLFFSFLRTFYSYQRETIQAKHASKLAVVRNLFQAELKTDSLVMETRLNALMEHDRGKPQSDSLEYAWLQRDRAMLLARAKPVFTQLKHRYGITHFYFTDANRINFLRVHHPGQYGDSIDRVTMQQAQRTMKTVSGIEIGPLGTLTLRVVTPFITQGKLIGFLELGKEIDALMTGLHKTLGVELIGLIEKTYLKRQNWEHGMVMFGHEAVWDRFPDVAMITQTLVDLPPALETLIATHPTAVADTAKILSRNDQYYFVNAFPLLEAGGQKLGAMVVLDNITTVVNAGKALMWRMGMLGVLIFTVLWALFYYLMVKVEEKLRTVNSRLIESRKYAEQASRSKSDFLATMSHEIRTPMNAIIGLSDLALMEDLPSRQRDYLNKIHHSSGSLLMIINDILDFSKIEAGKLELESVHFDLHDVLDHVTNMTAIKASEKGLNFLIAVQPDVNPALVGDPLRLGQILINLTNNAIKFTRTGEVVIRVTGQEKSQHKVQLLFAVKDTGVGIASNKINNLFQSFSQADTSTTRQHGGTGLGLAICKRLVAVMEGEIGVDSILGEGSTFHFTAKFGLDDKHTQPMLLPNNLQGKRALIVDQSPVSREILSVLMNTFGIQSDQAESSDQAIQKLENSIGSSRYHFVLIDWNMQEMDGLALGRHINKMLFTIRPFSIFISPYGNNKLQIESQSAGFDACVTKPVSQTVLFDSFVSKQSTAHKNDAINTRQMVFPIAPDYLRGLHLLVVEDDQINQLVVVELLRKIGIKATVADNGEEGVQAAKIKSFDGILMDMQMPVMGGIEATTIIRTFNHKTPIIAMTANAMAKDREQCFKAGMDDYITKPIDRRKLFDVLGHRLKRPDN